MNSFKLRLLYIGDRQYLHHTRFIEALSDDFNIKATFVLEDRFEDNSNFLPDIVLCAPLSEPLVYAVGRYKVPVIGICWAQEFNEPRSVFRNDSDYSSQLSQLTGIVVDNNYTQSIIRNNFYYRGPIKKIAFNLEPFKSSTTAKLINNRHPTFISARKFEPLYRNDLILEGLRILGQEFDLHLIAIGEGSQLKELKHKYQEESKSGLFRFTGKLTSRETIDLLNVSDFYISSARSDGISVTLIEAMSLGKVCIVSNFPSNLEIIQDGNNGFVFENENLNSLISKCKAVLQLDATELSRISNNAMDTVSQRYNWKQSRRELIDFVQSFVGISI